MKRTIPILMAVMTVPAFAHADTPRVFGPGSPFARVINHDNDDPGALDPGVKMEMNLRVLDSTSKRKVPNRFAPWGDVTWKANHGLIAERYNDGNYEAQQGWGAMHQYLEDNSAGRILRFDSWSRDQWIRSLSPAEKYDLLLGIADDGLAKNIGGFLDQTIGDGGAFPSWWGLCEGSAPASVYYPEPVKAVVLHSEAYDLDIPFYAPDIKGLATMLWSRFNTSLSTPESGTQCKTGDEASCFDTNPASFHAALHHFLDLSPGILIADVDPTPVVWNFPLVSYSESYYRPDQGSAKVAPDLASAAIPVSSWAADPRRAHRAPGAAYLVGVKMNFSYGVNAASPPLEGPLKRKINTRTVTYELELDPNYNMIGGEWVSGPHPDLLWTVPKGIVPDSPAEGELPPPSAVTRVVPRTWSTAARDSAEKLTPLRRVVELLVQKSQQ